MGAAVQLLNKLKVQNYRSINSTEIEFGGINALLGANNSGKSNLMKALNLLLGGIYPSVRSFDDRDFQQYDKTNPILLQITFDAPCTTNMAAWGFRLTSDCNDCDYVALTKTETGNYFLEPSMSHYR